MAVGVYMNILILAECWFKAFYKITETSQIKVVLFPMVKNRGLPHLRSFFII